MNRYIKAMEIGLANEKEGISYYDLVTELEKGLGYKFNHSSEYTFLNWFVDSFDFQGSKDKFKGTSKLELVSIMTSWVLFTKYQFDYMGKEFTEDENAPEIMKTKFFLKGNAAKQYLDYVELTDARKQAKQTSYFSIISILIAVIAICIGIFQRDESPQPPYDVKIIEDNTKVKELQKENDNLRKELHKAEMMVRVLESESK